MHVIITHWEHGWESFWNDGLFKVVKNKNDCRTHGYREKYSGIKRKNEREMRAKAREKKRKHLFNERATEPNIHPTNKYK